MHIDNPLSGGRNDARRDRAVSANVNYILSLMIMTLLLSGLALSSGNVIQDERSRVMRSQLEVLGERLASDLTSADQLARRSGSGTTLETTSDLPDQVVSRPYTITVRSTGGDYYELELVADAVTVTVTLYSRTDIANDEVPGGSVRIVYTGTQLEVNDAS